MRKIERLLVCLFFFIALPINAQRKVVIDKDTLVAITPKDLRTINGIIVDFEHTKELLSVKDTLLKLDSLHISNLEENLRLIEKREKIKVRKKSLFYGISGTILGLVIGLLIK